MEPENNALVVKKKTLKKVRTQFLHKKEVSDEDREVDPTTKYLNGNNQFMLQTSLGLVEIGRKLCAGPQYLNQYFNIVDYIIETRPTNKVVTLNIEFDKDMAVLPWEYTAKRLESYGDLELATLAHRIKKFHGNLHKIISQYEAAMKSDDDDDVAKNLWNKAKMRAKKACEELEKNEIFYKPIFYFSKNGTSTVSTTYSEGLLRAIGFTPESFLKWTQKNGNPTVFDPDCLVFQNAVKMFFDFSLFLGDPITNSVEYETFLYDAKGSKRKILVQAHYVLEPVEGGFYSHDYFIVKNIELASPVNMIKFKEPLNEVSESNHLKWEREVEENDRQM